MKKMIMSLIAILICMPQICTYANTYESSQFKTIDYNGNNFYAITNDGSLWVWNNNNDGKLKDDTKEERLKPIKIMDDVASVEAVWGGGYAIKKDGSLWTWDEQDSKDEISESLTPIRIMENVAQVSGSYHTLIIQKDGSLWGTGFNYDGQLGKKKKDNDVEKYAVPTKIMNQVKMAAAGNDHSIILKTDGSVWTFGSRYAGQLGDGDETVVSGCVEASDQARDSKFDFYNDTPQKILENMKYVFAGINSSFAITEDDALWFWGSTFGDLVGGTQIYHFAPFEYVKGVKSVNSQYVYNLVLKDDGTLWAYGDLDEYEQIKSQKLPMLITDHVNCVAGKAVYNTNTSLVLKDNGELFQLTLDLYGGKGIPTLTKVLDDVKIVDEPVSVPQKQFVDMDNKLEKMKKAVYALTKADIISGTSDTNFSPDEMISRAEIANLLIRLSAEPIEGDNGGFLDVPEDQWYYAVAGTSKRLNIVAGFEDQTFRGDEKITKEQMAVLAARLLRREQIGKSDKQLVDNITIEDADQISDWAKEETNYAISKKLISLNGNHLLRPKNEISRGEAAIILYRVYNLI